MGKFKPGVLGETAGKVGEVVFSHWKDIQYVRELGRKPSTPPTTAQLGARAAFTLTSNFMNGDCSSLFNIGFQSVTTGMTPFNKAFSINRTTAITGVYPALTIDYPKVVFSRGRLLSVPNIAVGTSVDAQLDLTWVNNANPLVPGDPDDPNLDQLTVAAYCPALAQWVIRQDAALRSAEGYDLSVPSAWSGETAQLWVFMVRADGKKVSNSLYAGAFILQ